MNFKLTKGEISLNVYATNVTPAVGAENDIVVITSMPMKNWVLSPDSPINEPRNEGDVWIQYSVSGDVFDVMNSNDFMLSIVKVYQYIAGRWETRNAKLYKNGAWAFVSTEFTAYIEVTYPAKSTCTVTDGATTLTDTNSTDAEKTVTFTMPNEGTWTIKCYNGADYDSSEKKKSAEVEITAEGQRVSEKLSYRCYLIQDGVVSEILGSLSNTNTTDEAAIYVVKGDNSGYGGTKTAVSEKEVDAKDYESLKFLAKGAARDKYGEITCTFGGSELEFIHGNETVSEYTEFHLDISAVDTATVQLAVGARSGTSELYISDMWLE
jgi:hypothetical protein